MNIGKRLPRKMKKKLGKEVTQKLLNDQRYRISCTERRIAYRRMERLVGFDNFWRIDRYQT